MYALQDYIDAQFGGPGKGFFRIVKTPAGGAPVINAGKLAVVLGVEVSEVLDCGRLNDVPHCNTDADRRRARPAGGARRALAVPGAQVRQRARRHAFDGGTPACSSTPATSTPPASGGRPSTARTPDPTTSPTNLTGEYAAHVLRSSSARCHRAAVPGPAAGLSAGAALQPEGLTAARRVRDPADDATAA